MKFNLLPLLVSLALATPLVSAVGLGNESFQKTTSIRGSDGQTIEVTTYGDKTLKFTRNVQGEVFGQSQPQTMQVEVAEFSLLNLLTLQALKKAALTRNVLRHAASTAAAGCAAFLGAGAGFWGYVGGIEALGVHQEQLKTLIEAGVIGAPVGGLAGLSGGYAAIVLASQKIGKQKEAVDAIYEAASTVSWDVEVKQTIPELIKNMTDLIRSQR